eukprot:gnl/Trimastix_PCT/1240.p1 GENE.gnl/Trimastix_PCT/1240~~gnl/Trimastix_PCT/1240.p1  ORF type:complete len:403 (-),score=41.35 gnl/Trimastix_PCT/1240:85-1293(-)
MSTKKDISMKTLQSYFHLPIKQVADELNVCTTVLKKICREKGIQRWPYRKIHSLDNTIVQLENSPEMTEAVIQRISALRKQRDETIINPNCNLNLGAKKKKSTRRNKERGTHKAGPSPRRDDSHYHPYPHPPPGFPMPFPPGPMMGCVPSFMSRPYSRVIPRHSSNLLFPPGMAPGFCMGYPQPYHRRTPSPHRSRARRAKRHARKHSDSDYESDSSFEEPSYCPEPPSSPPRTRRHRHTVLNSPKLSPERSYIKSRNSDASWVAPSPNKYGTSKDPISFDVLNEDLPPALIRAKNKRTSGPARLFCTTDDIPAIPEHTASDLEAAAVLSSMSSCVPAKHPREDEELEVKRPRLEALAALDTSCAEMVQLPSGLPKPRECPFSDPIWASQLRYPLTLAPPKP